MAAVLCDGSGGVLRFAAVAIKIVVNVPGSVGEEAQPSDEVTS